MGEQSAWNSDSWRAVEIGRQEDMAKALDAIAYGNRGVSTVSRTDDAYQRGLMQGRNELTVEQRRSHMLNVIIFLGSIWGALAAMILVSVFDCWSNPVAITAIFPLATMVTMWLLRVFWPEPEVRAVTKRWPQDY